MLLMQSLNKLNTPEQKLEAIIKKHAELVSGRMTENFEKETTEGVRFVFDLVVSCAFPHQAGGAPERPEAAQSPAEEVAPGHEGEGPAAERAQPGRAGSQ